MKRFLITSLSLPLLLPTAIFTLCALAAGLSPAETWMATLEQLAAPRQNLLVCGALGLFPVALLFSVLWLHRRFGGAEKTRLGMAWSGLAAILVVLTWANRQFWPHFLPSRTYPGFPHGLELVLGPLLFAPITMILGLLTAWLIGRRK